MRTKLLLAGVIAVIAVPAQSALISRAGGTMYYDTVLDITWLQDADLGGPMNWADSVAWADALVFGGFDDWRLPSMSVVAGLPIGSTASDPKNCENPFSVPEIQCRDNELAYMYYYNGVSLIHPGPFQNLGFEYWSGTESARLPHAAWFFVFFDPDVQQAMVNKDSFSGAWAVRSGDVTAAAPEPGTWLLLGVGALGLMRARKRGQPTVTRHSLDLLESRRA